MASAAAGTLGRRQAKSRQRLGAKHKTSLLVDMFWFVAAPIGASMALASMADNLTEIAFNNALLPIMTSAYAGLITGHFVITRKTPAAIIPSLAIGLATSVYLVANMTSDLIGAEHVLLAAANFGLGVFGIPWGLNHSNSRYAREWRAYESEAPRPEDFVTGQ